jgi:4-amino-4-deoxy-L-arabinose transferase-like glycosyltransferase
MRQSRPIALLLIFTAVVYLSVSFEPSLLDDADSTHAEAAKEVLERGDWVTLHVNGVRYLEKAPLLYWLVAISYRLFGVGQFAVRLPTALAIVLLAWMAYIFGRWAYSEKAGLYSAAAISSCTGMFLFTRFMIPEALMALLFTVAHYCFLRAFFGTGREKRFYFGFYAAMALAVLTKGLIGMVFIAGPPALFLLLAGRLAELKNLRLVSGTLLFLAIAAPWHLLAGWRNDRFFWFYFVNEHFLRFLGKREPKDYNKVPSAIYWTMHLAWLFPWSAGLLLLADYLPRSLRAGDRQTLVNLYLWLWAAIILVFFSFSTSQEYYTFPVYPAFALLLGAAFASAEESARGGKHLWWAQGALAAVGLIIAAILGTLVWRSRHVTARGDLAALLDQAPADAEQYTLSLGHFFDLTPQAFAELRGPAIGAALAFGLGFTLAFWFRHCEQHARAAAAMVASMGLLFICANRAQVGFDPVLSSRALAREIEQRWEPGAKIIFNGEYETGSSIAFYTNQQVLLLNGKVTGMAFGSTYPDAPPVFLNYEDVRRLWHSPARIFLFTENSKKETLLKNLNVPTFLVAERGGKSVLTNKP